MLGKSLTMAPKSRETPSNLRENAYDFAEKADELFAEAHEDA